MMKFHYQIAVVVPGKGLNSERWVDHYRKQGYAILRRSGFIEIWKTRR